ncbi:hypothetical protein L7F22_062746 [Adiantum nelumboides]|nr:hypothetical protein [Adiantum nelumboides]
MGVSLKKIRGGMGSEMGAWWHCAALAHTPPCLLPPQKQETFHMNLPVHLAAQHNHLDVLKRLLEAEVRCSHIFYVELFSKDGLTALHLAAQSGSTDIVDFLLNSQKTMSMRGLLRIFSHQTRYDEKGGWYFYGAEMMASPLHLAVKEGHLGVVQQILHFFHYKPYIWQQARGMWKSSVSYCKA